MTNTLKSTLEKMGFTPSARCTEWLEKHDGTGYTRILEEDGALEIYRFTQNSILCWSVNFRGCPEKMILAAIKA